MSSAEAQELATAIQTASFSTVRWREGYDVTEVDALLDGLQAAIKSGAEVDTLLTSARFTPARRRPGYDMDEVDRFLDQVRRAARAVRAPRPPQPDQPPAARDQHLPSVIQEQRGPLARLLGRGRR